MKTFLLAIFFFKFLNFYNKSNLFCQGIIAHLQWNDRTLQSGKAKGWGEKKRKKISHNHFFTKYMWSGIDCSCCQLKCSLATIMAQWKYKMAHHVYQALLLQTPIIHGGAQNVIPLIVHVTHFYHYKSIRHLVQN